MSLLTIEEFQLHHENVRFIASVLLLCLIRILLIDFIFQRQFEPIITSPSIVHHMEIFHCETDVDVEIPLYEGNCDDMPKEAKVCSRVISLWAMGASTFTYPKQAGLPIGGPNYNPYIRLEVHFNNPDILDGMGQYGRSNFQ